MLQGYYHKNSSMKAILLVLATSFVSLVLPGQSAQDREAVKKVVVAFQDDFNDGRFQKANTFTTADWEHINPLGGITKGREAVLNEVRGVHQTFLKGVTITIEDMTLRFMNPAVAIATVTHNITDYTTPDGVLHQKEKHSKTYVVVRQKGKWLLAHDHNTIVLNQKPR
jgi:uncharacterized protein (TIGR02246 family)